MISQERLQQRVHLGAGHGLRGRLPPHRQRQRQLLHLRLHVRQLQIHPPPPLQTVLRVSTDGRQSFARLQFGWNLHCSDLIQGASI